VITELLQPVTPAAASQLRCLLKKSVFRNTMVFTAAESVNKAIPFLLLPVITRYMSPADYGVVANFTAFINVLAVFVGVSAHGAVAVNYFQLPQEQLKAYIGNVLLILLGTGLVVLAAVVPASGFISAQLSVPKAWLFVGLIVALAQFITLINLALWQVEKRPSAYGAYQVAQTAVSMLLVLLMVVGLRWRWYGQIAGTSAAALLFSVLSVIVIFRRGYLKFELNCSYIRDALAFGLPLVPHILARWFLTGIDRFFLTSMHGASVTGLYSVGFQFGMIIGIVAASFNRSWVPFLFEKMNNLQHEGKLKLVKFTYAYFVAILLMALILTAVAPFVMSYFLGAEFRQASQFVFWIAIGYAFEGMYYMVVNQIYYMKKTHWLAFTTVLVGICHVPLSYFLVRHRGALGAAQATTLSLLLTFVLVGAVSMKVYPLPWRLSRLPDSARSLPPTDE
jgi:O-antigen/teichoic acid export membrane protein